MAVKASPVHVQAFLAGIMMEPDYIELQLLRCLVFVKLDKLAQSSEE